MCKPNSRWLGPKRRTETSAPRYTPNELKAIGKYREPTGYRNGAKIRTREVLKNYSTFDYESNGTFTVN